MLFGALPIYQAGVRAAYPIARGLQVRIGAMNGWSGLVDNNRDKSLCAELLYESPRALRAAVRWVGGVERDPGQQKRGSADAARACSGGSGRSRGTWWL